MEHLRPHFIMNQESPRHLKTALFALYIAGGHVGLPIIIATFLFSKQVARHPTLINFCFTWVLYSISYSVLFYIGAPEGINGSSWVCQLQSAMVHGASPMTSLATFLVVLQILFAFREPHRQRGAADQRWPYSTRLIFSLALPYVVYVAYAVAAAIGGFKFPHKVRSPTGLYCTTAWEAFHWAVPGFVCFIMGAGIIIEAALAIQYFKLRSTVANVFPLADRKISRSVCIRVVVFTSCTIVSFSVGILFFQRPEPWAIVVEAALPLAVAVVFGSQRDLFRVWCFCRRRPKEAPAQQDIPLTPLSETFRSYHSQEV